MHSLCVGDIGHGHPRRLRGVQLIIAVPRRCRKALGYTHPGLRRPAARPGPLRGSTADDNTAAAGCGQGWRRATATLQHHPLYPISLPDVGEDVYDISSRLDVHDP